MNQNIYSIKSLAKSVWREQKRFIGMLKSYGGYALATLMLLTVLLLLWLVPFGSLNAETNWLPTSSKTVTLDIHLYESTEAVTQACNQKRRVNGCAYPETAGVVIIHAREPRDWCDFNAIETLGHELMHALEKSHGTFYVPVTIRIPEDLNRGDCTFYKRSELPQGPQ